jgi:hypothetical protein
VDTAVYDDIVALSKRKDPAVLANLLPTFQVFAFHQSDLQRETDSSPIAIALPQSSFGYFAYHEGPMYAWAWALDGAEQLAPNIFRIEVPNGGVAPVRIRLQAIESPDEARVASNPAWPFNGTGDQSQCHSGPCPKCQGCCCKKAQVSALGDGASSGGLALITGLLSWLVFRRRRPVR